MRNRKVRILLIDDDEDDHFMFSRMMDEISEGTWTVEWASNYDQGSSRLLAQVHDICFLDYRLGRQTGIDLLNESFLAGCKTPVVMLTGYGEQEVDLAAMRAGAADYLIKDQITPSGIERCIRYALHRAEMLETLREREAQVLMQDRLASVGLLASSLAHEIGTPLGVIRGRAEYIALQLGDNLPIRKSADIIVAQIDRVAALIRTLLDLARGGEQESTDVISIGSVVTEVTELLEHEFRKSGVQLRNEIVTDVSVKARSAALQQVLLNLLVNAVHAIESAQLNPKSREQPSFIRLRLQDGPKQVAIEIEDNGCGISTENLRNLFKPFFTTKDVGMGTGLGLVTSYRLVEGWGGTIQVRSEEGVGSIFRVLLPKLSIEDGALLK